MLTPGDDRTFRPAEGAAVLLADAHSRSVELLIGVARNVDNCRKRSGTERFPRSHVVLPSR